MRYLTFIGVAIAATLWPGLSIAAATPEGQGFASADAAARALVDAAKTHDIPALLAILGPASKKLLVTSDSVADRRVLDRFVALADTKMKLAADSREPHTRTLLIGKDGWPLPIPLVAMNGKWYFDVEQGKQEIIARRIGSNELDAIEICRGYVEAQDNFAEQDRTSNGVPHYAQRIISSSEKHDGLYWPSASAGDESPISEVISRAFAEGYTKQHEPYHGYYFKILTSQGPHAPEGAMSYLENGLMIKGFALIAWPSDYRSTGIMTFIVDRTGIVYQKDLGAKTAAIAETYRAYDPDETWAPVATSARK